jgi:ubiquinone/menaquinone biosynthesis C-methylase UbiE
VDYDTTNIPEAYDRGRGLTVEQLRVWLTTVERCAGGRKIARILDLGCGTGRFTTGLADHFGADAIGVDPSNKMLDLARAKPNAGRVRYERGSAEAIPLPSTSRDLVFMSMAFHHFTDPYQAARECRRVLGSQGTLFVRTGTREKIGTYAYVDFFPESRELLEERLPTGTFIREVFESAGLRSIAAGVLTQEIAPSYAGYAEKLATRADSILAELPSADFERGLRAVRAHAARVDPIPVTEPIDYFVFEKPAF